MKKVLLVSENSEKIRRFGEYLSAKSYMVDLAVSGVEGVQRSFRGFPDVILLDSANINKNLFKSQLAQHELCGNIPIVGLEASDFENYEFAEKAMLNMFKKFKILIAEDDRQMAAIFRSMLVNSGYEVRVSHDGADVLALIKSWKPDLVVLDVMLPIIDGFHICRMINEDPGFVDPRPKILIVSGRSSDMDQNLGAACGAEDYLVKPVNNVELMQKIKKILMERE